MGFEGIVGTVRVKLLMQMFLLGTDKCSDEDYTLIFSYTTKLKCLGLEPLIFTEHYQQYDGIV